MNAAVVASGLPQQDASRDAQTLAEWHARPVGELSLARQAVYAAALSRDFPATVPLRPWLRVIGGSERRWRAFVRGASEDEIVWAQAALDAWGDAEATGAVEAFAR